MTDRYDLCSPRQRRNSDKVYWHKCGAMFPARDGKEGFSLVFDSLPIADNEGAVRLVAFPAKPRDERERESYASQGGGRGRQDDLDEDIPF